MLDEKHLVSLGLREQPQEIGFAHQHVALQHAARQQPGHYERHLLVEPVANRQPSTEARQV